MNDLSKEEIDRLPTINELVELLEAVQREFSDKGGWLQDEPMLRHFAQMGLHNPYASLFNNAKSDEFIVNHLTSGRYCCKPNIASTPFLVRGEKKKYPYIVSAFNRGDKDDKLVSNLKTADFISLVKTHPLCRMFDNGINLESYNRTLFFETNYYGLAQHYNFNTGLIDFSSSALVAAFFAVTENHGNDIYSPITDTTKYPYGVLYMHGMNYMVSFRMFCTIGQQVFPRCGAQKGFAFQEKLVRLNINEMVRPLPFKHDAECSRLIFEKLDGGKALFPKDELAQHAQHINNCNEVSFLSFADNLYANPQDNIQANLDRCQRKGITVNPNLKYCFTPEMLQDYFADIKNGIWERYCAPIHFPCSNGAKLKEELLALPKNDYYRQYFEQRYYDKLFYHTLEDKYRAEQKLRRITIKV